MLSLVRKVDMWRRAMGAGKVVVGALMLWLPVNAAINHFSDDAVGAVRSASLKDIVHADLAASAANGAVFTDTRAARQGVARTQSAADAADEIVGDLKGMGVDVGASYHSLLAANTRNVSQLSVREIQGTGGPGCRMGERVEKTVVMSHVESDGSGKVKVDLVFGAKDKTFLKPLSAKVECLLAQYVTLLDDTGHPVKKPVPIGLGNWGGRDFGPLGKSTLPR
jgi:hypothetical protein